MQLFHVSVQDLLNPTLLQGLSNGRDAGPALLVADGSAAEWSDVALTSLAIFEGLDVLGCVTLAVVRSLGPTVANLEGFDLIATTGNDPDMASSFAGSDDEVNKWIEDLARRIELIGVPAVVGVRLCRHIHTMNVETGLLVEATAYSMLQAGPSHREWLRTRGTSPIGRSDS